MEPPNRFEVGAAPDFPSDAGAEVAFAFPNRLGALLAAGAGAAFEASALLESCVAVEVEPPMAPKSGLEWDCVWVFPNREGADGVDEAWPVLSAGLAPNSPPDGLFWSSAGFAPKRLVVGWLWLSAGFAPKSPPEDCVLFVPDPKRLVVPDAGWAPKRDGAPFCEGGGPAGVVEKLSGDGLFWVGVDAPEGAAFPKSPPLDGCWLEPPPKRFDIGACDGVVGLLPAAEHAGGARLFSSGFLPNVKPEFPEEPPPPPPNRLLVPPVLAPPKLNAPPPEVPAFPKSDGLFSPPDVAVLPKRLLPEDAGVLPVLCPKRLEPVLDGAEPKSEGAELPLEAAGPPKVNFGGSGMAGELCLCNATPAIFRSTCALLLHQSLAPGD